MTDGLMVVAGAAPLLQRFVNRDVDVAALIERLTSDVHSHERVRVVALNGLPGVGKTALAIEVAKRTENRFPGGQLYLDFKAGVASGKRGEPGEAELLPLVDALTGCLDRLGVAAETRPSSVLGLVRLFREKTADRPVLMILENVTTRAQIEQLLPAAPGSSVLVTGTARMTELRLSGGVPYRLEPVSTVRGMHMLAQMCRRRRLAGAHGVGELVTACGGLPLTLRVSAARLEIRPSLQPADIASEIADRRQGLEVFDLFGENPLQAELHGVYADLKTDSRRLYRVIGALRSVEFSDELLAASARMGLRAVRSALDELHEAGLVETLDDDRYAMHDLVWRHAAAAAKDHDRGTERVEALRLMVEFLLVRAAFADRAMLKPERYRCTSHDELLADRDDPFRLGGGTQARSWMDRERWTLLLALQTAVEHGWNRQAWQLAEAMSALYLQQRYYVSWTESARLGAQAAMIDGRPDAAARLRSFSSRAWLELGEPERANTELTASLALYRDARLRDRRLLASIRELVGRYQDHVGDHVAAQQEYREAVDLFRAEHDARGVAFVLLFFGQSLHAGKQPEQAREMLVNAIKRIHEDVGDGRMEGRARTSLAVVTAELASFAAALPVLTEAIHLLSEGGHAYHELNAQVIRADWAEGPLHDAALRQESLARALALDTRLGGARRAELIARLEHDHPAGD